MLKRSTGLPEASGDFDDLHYGEKWWHKRRPTRPALCVDYKAYIKEFMDQSSPDEVLFVTGSLYFIAEVRAFLLEGKQLT